MSCTGNLIWDVNKRLIGYNEPNTIRTNYLGKNKTSHLLAKRIAGHAKNKDVVLVLIVCSLLPVLLCSDPMGRPKPN